MWQIVITALVSALVGALVSALVSAPIAARMAWLAFTRQLRRNSELSITTLNFYPGKRSQFKLFVTS